ncbi:hypothetical protein BASA60_010193 [Batrachochytrium salamandrivorans]|nr:hypothetical protein BASA60_010193 [Batrachochytrium salamandrivorans]
MNTAPTHTTPNTTLVTAASLFEATSAATTTTPALPAPLAKKSNKCNLDGCNDRVVKIVGDCRYCMSKFCTKHRLPEAHACSNIETCRQNSHERLAGKLLKERTVAAQV